MRIEDDKTHSYEVTHQDSKWDSIESPLRESKWVYADPDESLYETFDEFTIMNDPAPIENTLSPEEHLSLIEEDLAQLPDVDRTELADE
ncbi:hypothetical protein HSR121_2068 [Halapricum desulfuricans]|uniref:Uncharacterized protein n=1 Tax=Halapricum desulfuricans TaxID=2841257 RepID=A0A897MWA6_9EURY|nr:hypothetical protein HSR121_2068 [Halapricum desulfuricans]